MRPSKIHLPGASAALLLIVLSGITCLLPARSFAQCPGTLGSITYDTTYTSSSASSSFSYSLPQFPTSSKTLYAAVFKSTVTVNAAVNLLNASGNPIAAPSLQLFRSDGFNSTVTGSQSNALVSPTTPIVGTPIGNFSTELITAPNIITNVQIVNDSLTPANTAGFNGFNGSGSVAINYSTNNIALPQQAGLFAASTAITDNIKFSITFYYCDPGTLSLDVVNFTAVRQDDESVLLNWITENEQLGRKYVIEVSGDGVNFADYATQPSDPVNNDATYAYTYQVPPSAKGRLYFRLRLDDTFGSDHYSVVRLVNLGSGTSAGFTIYPNPPTDYIILSFPAASSGWQVDIMAADGSRVQRGYYPNTSQARVNFTHKLPPGTYFARATNPQTAQSYVASFIMH